MVLTFILKSYHGKNLSLNFIHGKNLHISKKLEVCGAATQGWTPVVEPNRLFVSFLFKLDTSRIYTNTLKFIHA